MVRESSKPIYVSGVYLKIFFDSFKKVNGEEALNRFLKQAGDLSYTKKYPIEIILSMLDDMALKLYGANDDAAMHKLGRHIIKAYFDNPISSVAVKMVKGSLGQFFKNFNSIYSFIFENSSVLVSELEQQHYQLVVVNPPYGLPFMKGWWEVVIESFNFEPKVTGVILPSGDLDYDLVWQAKT